ncbi:MAG: Holliday junction resolvase RuvX [Spirochaetota bacterium]|nr:Holliday junction resolvase RuvX [Spirochaetota bacterium]
MARILCLDFGHVRIGVAISDQSRTIATSNDYIAVKKGNVLQKIITIVSENECDEIVIGLPISLNGNDTQKTVEVRKFADILSKHFNIPITLWDERLSSYTAENILKETNVRRDKRKGKRDSLSAQIILQGYLDSKK